MSARNSWFLNSAILLLYYACGGIEYISAQPTLTNSFNTPPFRPQLIRFDDRFGGYEQRHPWDRHRFRHRHGYGPHKDFVIAQPKFHSSEEFNTNSVGNAPPFVKRLWYNPNNPHHPRWHDCHRPMAADPDLNGENVQGAGYEAGSFGQTAIFENTNNGIREWENSGPPRRVGGEPKEDAVIVITPTTPTTTRAAPPTTTESTERAVDITEPMIRTYETTTVEITEPTTKTYETTTVEITEPTTKTYETATVNNSGAISTTDATVTAAPTESTFAIDIRSGFA